ncbi:MAG: restriction endonuclease, partial [Verrucomicrobiota bacterium]
MALRARSKWIIVILFFLTASLGLMGNEPPAGILITKASPSASESQAANVIEYQTVTEHLVPATDFITVTRPDGDRDDIPKNLIIRRLDYPRELNRNIISAAALSDIEVLIRDLRDVVTRYPMTHRYLDSKISLLQKEIDLFHLGARKINGAWISSADFQKLLAEDQARKAAIVEAVARAKAEAAAIRQKAEDEKARAKRQQEEATAAEAKRVADEQAAIEAKRKAEAILKKKKAEALLAEQAPRPSIFSFLPLKTMLVLLILGGGGVVLVRKLKGKSGPGNLAALDWPKFELLVAEIYRRRGYNVEISSGFGSEEGIDLKLTRGDEVTLVQCKHWKMLKDYKVSAQEIMNLYQMVANDPGVQGIFVSTGEYTSDAREFIEGKPIQLMGLSDVELLVPQVARKNENLLNIKSWVAEFIANAKIVDPECPKCQKPMLLKSARDGTPN